MLSPPKWEPELGDIVHVGGFLADSKWLMSLGDSPLYSCSNIAELEQQRKKIANNIALRTPIPLLQLI
jgi:hypothetical protein